MENIDQKTLFVAFTPGQAADLTAGRSVFPQETSERFGLRTTKEDAIERAHYFHQWHSHNMWTAVKRRFLRKDLSLPPFV